MQLPSIQGQSNCLNPVGNDLHGGDRLNSIYSPSVKVSDVIHTANRLAYLPFPFALLLPLFAGLEEWRWAVEE